MAEMRRLRDLPAIDALKTADEAKMATRERVEAAKPATIKAFEKMTPAEKDAALKVLLLQAGLCT